MSNGQGSWAAPIENALEIVGVHAVVLHTGHVLYWCFDKRIVGEFTTDEEQFNELFRDPNLGSYQLWDPATGTAVAAAGEIGSNAFCAGQCVLPDGTIFVAGGQDVAGEVELLEREQWHQNRQWSAFFEAFLGGSDNGALKNINTYDPLADAWTPWPDMPEGRYYPTCLLLDNGSAFLAGGLSNLLRWVLSGGNWCENDQFEIYWSTELAFAGPAQKFRSADQYPIIRQLPGSRQLFVHIETTTYLFDLNAMEMVQGAEFMPPGVGRQTYPMQSGHVLLPQRQGDPPRILIVGGSTATGFDFDTHSDAPAVRNAFIFEYDKTNPTNSTWRLTKGDPVKGRLLSDTVLLPDGSVFVVNGIVKGAAAGHSGATAGTAELFDPVTETFREVAPPSSAHPRSYHATAVLLPDARVAIAGNTAAYNPGESASQDDRSIEIYSPPYLEMGPRPVVNAGVPASVDYGATITVDNSMPPSIDQAILMRPCAVTHTVDMSQLAVWLAAQPGKSAGTFEVTLPSDRTLAPPGPYMLFFLAAGVPSIASWIFLGAPAPSGGTAPGGEVDCEAGGPYAPVSLGSYEDQRGAAQEAFDGDCTIGNISNEYRLALESRHGAITVERKVDQHSWVDLKACSTISIGQKIDQHAKVTIRAQGSVHFGQGIDQHSEATIVAQGDVILDEAIDQHSIVEIRSEQGSITIHQKVNEHSEVTLIAPNGSVTIDQSVGGGSSVKWHAQSFSCPDTGGGSVTQI